MKTLHSALLGLAASVSVAFWYSAPLAADTPTPQGSGGSWIADAEEAASPGKSEPDSKGNEMPRVAVFEFNVRGNLGMLDAGAIIAEWMLSALADTGRLTLMERVLLNKVLEEQELQSSYLADESTMAAEAGRLYGVDAIVSGTVIEWVGTISIVARLVDTSTGEILSAAEIKAYDRHSIPDQIDRLAQLLVRPLRRQVTAPTAAALPPPQPLTATESVLLSGNAAGLTLSMLPDARFRLGEPMQLRVSAARPGYLLVLNIDPAGELSTLYPFPCEQAACAVAELNGGQPLVIPGPNEGIQLIAGRPAGQGWLIAILSSQVVDAGDVEQLSSLGPGAPRLGWRDAGSEPSDYSVATVDYIIAGD